jgi:hypothetical protein
MDEIDYKQLAKNVLILMEKNVSIKIIERYIKWILNQDPKYLKRYYNAIHSAMDIINEN